jgi:hypothetical protein
MSLTRKSFGILFFASIASLGGCSVVEIARPDPAPAPINSTPLVIDEAMQRREWEPVSSVYYSGRIVETSTWFPLEPASTMPNWERGFVENALFVVQAVALPINVAIDPPWETTTYTGIHQDPSYTAVPPLQTDEQSMNSIDQQSYR